MPVPTQPASPPLTTPSHSNTRKTLNNTSYTPTVVSGTNQQKMSIVTRVAIEGKAKRGQDGASIKMFLKISIPVDLVTPGSTIPLFPEENVKVLKSQVHPLDHNSVPYNFSSTLSPFLHSASRALNLPPQSAQTFNSAFQTARTNGHTTSIRPSRSESNDNAPPVDSHYTGQILVSGYNVAFVVPKELLPRPEFDEESYMKTPSKDAHSRSKLEDEVHARTPSVKRRISIGERNQAQFMAAIDIWVPFLSKPPRSPFLLSIPTPRCLHNHIRLRIFPPQSASTSFASLSSVEEDSNTWDLTSDPHVTRSTSRPSRAVSYSHFADDESSDTSAGAYENCVIQGTFPSAQRIRVRWAKPPRKINLPREENAMRRVGVENINGEMTCIVRGQASHPTKPDIEGILMDVEYKGECKGIWFPGVATMLGLDLSLVSRNCDVWWAPGLMAQWDISGGEGYTGFSNHPSMSEGSVSRTLSVESNGLSSELTNSESYETPRTRTQSSSSNGSLLRAPLPSQHVEEYSFEGSHAALPSGASSVSSLPVSSETNRPLEPCTVITVHLNLNDLQPSVKNSFDFRISGSIVVAPRSPLSHGNEASSSKTDSPELITLPRFTVLAADNENTSLSVRNEFESASVEVFQAHGDAHKDPQVRKTVLHQNRSTRCGEEGGRIALKFDAFRPNGNGCSISRPRTPNNNMLHRSTRNALSTRAKRDGPPIITSVDAVVTAFTPADGLLPDGYAVRLTLKTPMVVDSEWLEFGISMNSSNVQSSSSVIKPRPKVALICASVDGVPVKADMIKAVTNAPGMAASFDGKEWIAWGKVHCGGLVGGNMIIDYLVKEEPFGKGKKKLPHSIEIDVLLPTFFLSVARLEVKIDAMPGLDIPSVRSEFDYVRSSPEGYRLLLCSMKEYTQPQLTLIIRKGSGSSSISFTKWSLVLTWACLLVTSASLYRLSGETDRLKKLTEGFSGFIDTWESEIPTITTTATMYDGSGMRWYFGDLDDSSSLPSSTSTIVQPALITPDLMPSKTTTDTLKSLYAPSYTDNFLKESSVTIRPSYSAFDAHGLVPFDRIFSFTWTNEHDAALRHALEKLTVSVQFVWDICRKLYHYPLDPP